jgi:hypothetical protein
MVLVPAMIAWSTTAKIHLVSVTENGGPVGYTAYCGARIPYGEVWEVADVSPLTCKRCFTKASKDSRFHAEADCPECDKHLTRPLGHLVLTHGWDKDEARRWVRLEAYVVTREMAKRMGRTL